MLSCSILNIFSFTKKLYLSSFFFCFVTLRGKLPVQQKWPRSYNTPCKKKRTFLSGLEQKTFLFWLTPYIYMLVQPDFGDLKKLWYSIMTIVCYTVSYVMLQVMKKIQEEVFFLILSFNNFRMNVNQFCRKRIK